MENVVCKRRDGSTFGTTAVWAEQNAKTLEFHGTVVVGPAEAPAPEPAKPLKSKGDAAEKKDVPPAE